MMKTSMGSSIHSRFGAFSARLSLDHLVPFQSAIGALVIFFIAAVGTAFEMPESTVTLLYMVLVLLFAMRMGFFQASILSIAAILCRTYFFAVPIYGFNVFTAKNALALLLFELTALVVSQLAGSERLHAAESLRHRTKLERLYAVSRKALTIDLSRSAEQQMAELIQAEFELDAVAICNATFNAVGITGAWATDPDSLCQRVRGGGMSDVALQDGTRSAELRTPHRTFGTLLVRGGGLSELGLESLASLVALTVERHHAFEKEGEAEAARRTEQLRTTVLDGLAHAFKTPLTVIRAASSGLLELGDLTEIQRDLTGMIDEQSTWLDELATQLLQTATVEGEDICLQLETVDVDALLHEVVADFQQEWTRAARSGVIPSPIQISLPERIMPISADHDMLRSTLSELLENAVKYSGPGKPVSLSASRQGDEVLLSVHSWSSVIRMEDRERIFDRFYRSQDHRDSARGTGIGLSVARRTAEAHMGNIWVTSSEHEGTTFHISLPLRHVVKDQQERTENWQRRY